MAEDNKNSYDLLLEQIDNLKKENETLRKEFNELRDFNRALLARGKTVEQSTSGTQASDKLNKYLEGE